MTAHHGTTHWLKPSWAWIGANHEAITLVFAVIAAGYVLFEYLGKEESERVKHTLELQARYSQTDFLNARIKLNSLMLDPDTKKTIDKEKGDAKLKKIADLIHDAKLEGSILMQTEFFNQAATCIEHKICDVATACAAFYGDAVGLRNTYQDLFKMWKAEWGEDLMERSWPVFKKQCGTVSG